MKKVMIGLFMILVVLGLSAGQVDVDFNNAGDMNDFDLAGFDDVVYDTANGIDDTGSVKVPYIPSIFNTRIVTYTTGYNITQENEPIVVSAFIENLRDGGYAGLGFSSSSTNTSTDGGMISNVPSIGMRFYSSGASIYNNGSIALDNGYFPDIALSWYKVVLTITPLVNDEYEVKYELFLSNSSGSISPTPLKSGTTTFVNETFADGMVYPYFASAGHRVDNVDNFSFTYHDQTLPVTLSSFTATVTSQELVNLQWTTESESNIFGFNVYRSEQSDLASAIRVNARIIEGTNTSLQQTYSYSDSEFETNSTYYYWLESSEMNNDNCFFGPVSVFTGSNNEDVIPTIEGYTGIESAYPNPFSPNTEISYKLRENANVKMGIYNLKGQLIKSLVNNTKAGGNHKIMWDGHDNKGKRCSSGIYFVRMQANEFNSFYKIMLTK
ncbi:T9SS type A sorting domain-containing protein [bacterium]|nr:T9SS type A sorting domain-containing protein [bacterium]